MAERTFGEEVSRELTAKAAMWGPPLAGAAVAGPVGFLVGLIASVAILVSGESNSPPPGGEHERR